MGARLARPDRPVVLLSGDGAFGFNLQELVDAEENEHPLGQDEFAAMYDAENT